MPKKPVHNLDISAVLLLVVVSVELLPVFFVWLFEAKNTPTPMITTAMADTKIVIVFFMKFPL